MRAHFLKLLEVSLSVTQQKYQVILLLLFCYNLPWSLHAS